MNPNTPVGEVRMLVGDIDGTDNGDGTANFTYLSDSEIQARLDLFGDNILRATGAAIKQLALNAALTGISIKADDLAIDNRTRGTSLLEIAQSWISEADADDAAEVAGEFILVPPTGNSHRGNRANYEPFGRWGWL